ncbi:hypothetical protein SVIO_105720 [Streptomyces violaceusniger]|uniref:Uncharacterized protein n=1 Tax=Streptomyces violaceusniger TaxID=68280 RepID=A0A4D4LQ18_STRVO|nr:hypothetical protein SVIO_105720 [Streptomyces violaceusniger]
MAEAVIRQPSSTVTSEGASIVFRLIESGRTGTVWTRSAAQGAVAGAVGGLVMTLGEKAEQCLTGLPDSFVPARTLRRLLAIPEKPEKPGKQPVGLNLAMHMGQAVLVGSLRGVMATAGLRGPWASVMLLSVRLTNDQTLENPPASEPRHGHGPGGSWLWTSSTKPCTRSRPAWWRTY